MRAIRHVELPTDDMSQIEMLMQINKRTCFTNISSASKPKALKSITGKHINQMYNSKNH